MAAGEPLSHGGHAVTEGGGVRQAEERVAFFSIESPGRSWVFPYGRILFAHADTAGNRFFMRTISHDLWLTGQKLGQLIALFQRELVADIRTGSSEWGTIEEIEVSENPAGMFQ
ncbi:hypothetical protein [Methylacidimicrobium tartarophylax]|uniref:Uncharacterized protein n=1 Tax=Methylacidimicrobium tartarophylax TaxID=1041768 RepID=A0A5E6MHA7_9BACT|nr:hypothetical protein [Methylacidimicrobium tartarophylax]VVM07277.1 hypothetical protein MAMT_01646 [Methylacidimicrobium tartarophylax]